MKLNRLLSLLLAGVMALGLAAPGFADALPGVTVEVTGPEDAPPEDGLPQAPMEEAPIEEPLGAGPGDPVYEFVARLYLSLIHI